MISPNSLFDLKKMLYITLSYYMAISIYMSQINCHIIYI